REPTLSWFAWKWTDEDLWGYQCQCLQGEGAIQRGPFTVALHWCASRYDDILEYTRGDELTERSQGWSVRLSADGPTGPERPSNCD
ncbi:MAG: hypothetical protein KAW49_01565, partial [Anaerolineae bacterium]|nr:hypothetical protein [Anaerolineae bacterium]